MLSLGATWISDQPRYRWKAFLLLMITALLLLTNMFTQRFMPRDGAHMHVADIVEKVIKSTEHKSCIVLYPAFILCTGDFHCKDSDSRDTHLTAFHFNCT